MLSFLYYTHTDRGKQQHSTDISDNLLYQKTYTGTKKLYNRDDLCTYKSREYLFSDYLPVLADDFMKINP